MQIREGAYYRTRSGDVVGPLQPNKIQRGGWASHNFQWYDTGRFIPTNARHMSEVIASLLSDDGPMDLISEVYVSDTPPSDDVMLNLSEIARTKVKAMGEGNFGMDENPPCGIRLRWLVKVVDRPHDTPPDALLPDIITDQPRKTLRDELEEKAALAILSGYYASPSLWPSKDPFGDIWDAAKGFVEARKK
jgi:hypothetical protein